MPAPARILAFDILRRVETGAWASDLLLAHSGNLDSRDAGLASEIVFGVLRYRAQLDFLIEHYSARRQKLDSEVRIALRMGIYQLRYLERIPPHAAVGDSVDLVKRAHLRSAAGFVNAILRQVDRDPVTWPNREVELSCPEWLLARWEKQFGVEVAEGIARAALKEPEKYTRGTRQQDIGAQSVVPLLALEAGQSFLDLCAAPGNKTAQALESGVLATACDLHFHRLSQMKNLDARLVVLDGTQPLPFARRFDRILVDAPCSGTGTLGRNPEAKWRFNSFDLPALQARQIALLKNAREWLAPGGLLVYSTCSLEPEENEDVIAAAVPGGVVAAAPAGVVAAVPADVAAAPAGVVADTMRRLPGRDAGDGFFAAVIKS